MVPNSVRHLARFHYDRKTHSVSNFRGALLLFRRFLKVQTKKRHQVPYDPSLLLSSKKSFLISHAFQFFPCAFIDFSFLFLH